MDYGFCRIDGKNLQSICSFMNDAEEKSDLNNARMKKMVFFGYPRLCLFAKKDIDVGEEIRHDYGEDPSKLFWRTRVELRMNLVKSDRIKGHLVGFNGVLRHFQHYFSYTTETIDLFMTPRLTNQYNARK